MKGIIYTRVSSDEQVDGTSLASQEELCRRYCEQKEIEVVGLFREEGETAKDLSLNNRSQFLAALEYCRRAKNVEAFVVFKVDRFARNTEDHFSVRRILMSYGTALYSVTEPIGNKPAEKFIETVLAGAAEYDNAIRKQRCTDGMRSRLTQGIWPFRAPVGYACAHHRMRKEKKTVADEPHPELFPIIQRALRDYASGKIVSQKAFVAQLNGWGFAAAHGHAASPQLVDRMLGRYLPFYGGHLVNPWTGDQTDGLHMPMLTEHEFAQIQLRRFGPIKPLAAKRHVSHPDFPLRRLLRCNECGRGVTGAHSRGNGGRYGYYFCSNSSCPKRVRLPHTPLNSTFIRQLRGIRPDRERLASMRQTLRRLLEDRFSKAARETDASKRKLADLSERRLRVCEMREDGTYSADAFRERIRAIDQSIATLHTQTAGRPILPDVRFEDLAGAAEWIATHLAAMWERLSTASRTRFERFLFPTGFSFHNSEGFRTNNPGLWFALFGSGLDGKSLEVNLREISSNQIIDFTNELVALREIAINEGIVSHEDEQNAA
ncbi:MAG: site-specific recombinase [Bryobacterales bacterium]|nr:site-specific recombinase [Bryobacterales bacterium]